MGFHVTEELPQQGDRNDYCNNSLEEEFSGDRNSIDGITRGEGKNKIAVKI